MPQNPTISNTASAPKKSLLLMFSIVAFLSIGGGIILIFAHNWSTFVRPLKIILAFAPLLIAQLLCVVALLQKKSNKTFTESSTVLLFCAVGACIALISQIFQIQGSLGQFMFLWILLMLPALYIFQSSALSLLCSLALVYLTRLVLDDIWWNNGKTEINSLAVPLVLFLMLAFYIYYQRHSRNTAVMAIQNWCLCIVITFSIELILRYILNSFGFTRHSYAVFFSLSLGFLLLYLFGNRIYSIKGVWRNAYRSFALIAGFFFIFNAPYFFSDSLPPREQGAASSLFNAPYFFSDSLPYDNVAESRTVLIILIMNVIIAILAYLSTQYTYMRKNNSTILARNYLFDSTEITFMLFLFLGLLQHIFHKTTIYIDMGLTEFDTSIGSLLSNALIVLCSVALLIQGSKHRSMRTITFGMLLIVLWLLIKFLDTDISYLWKGVVSILLGLGVLLVTIVMYSFRWKKNA